MRATYIFMVSLISQSQFKQPKLVCREGRLRLSRSGGRYLAVRFVSVGSDRMHSTHFINAMSV